MPKKFTDLAELTAPDMSDIIPLVDTSANASKKITIQTLVNLFIPTGAQMVFAGSAAPTGWLLCDGSAVSRATYAALYDVIGTTYGDGDGTSTFNVPNTKGRVVVGRDEAQAEFDTLGKTYGAKIHTLLTAEMPSHFHVADPPDTTSSWNGDHSHTYWLSQNWSVAAGSASIVQDIHTANNQAKGTSTNGGHNHTTNIPAFNTASTGGGGAHNNVQPGIAENYIIKT